MEKLQKPAVAQPAETQRALGENLKAEIFKLLRDCPVFRGVASQDLTTLVNISKLTHFNRGDIIINEDKTPQSFQMVAKGLVKIVKISPNGKEFIIDIRKKGEIFAEISFTPEVSAYASTRAITDTDILSISNKDFLPFVFYQPSIPTELFRLEMVRIRNLYAKLIDLIAEKAEQRVIKILFNLVNEYGTTLEFTHLDIAEMSGTTMETTTRILSSLKRKKILKSNRGQITILNKAKLLS